MSYWSIIYFCSWHSTYDHMNVCSWHAAHDGVISMSDKISISYLSSHLMLCSWPCSRRCSICVLGVNTLLSFGIVSATLGSKLWILFGHAGLDVLLSVHHARLDILTSFWPRGLDICFMASFIWWTVAWRPPSRRNRSLCKRRSFIAPAEIKMKR